LTESEESSFSEEKEAKRLFALLGARLLTSARPQEQSFLLLFFKKEESGGYLAGRPALMSHPTGRHGLHRRNSDYRH
jgi:hypothetical protein